MRSLVTGGSGALGQAICAALAQAGHEVWVHANRHLAQAEAVAQQIVAAGGSAHAIAFDVTDADATLAALKPFIDDAPVQILVNNAGIHDDAPMAGMSRQQWHSVLDVTLRRSCAWHCQISQTASSGAMPAPSSVIGTGATGRPGTTSASIRAAASARDPACDAVSAPMHTAPNAPGNARSNRSPRPRASCSSAASRAWLIRTSRSARSPPSASASPDRDATGPAAVCPRTTGAIADDREHGRRSASTGCTDTSISSLCGAGRATSWPAPRCVTSRRRCALRQASPPLTDSTCPVT